MSTPRSGASATANNVLVLAATAIILFVVAGVVVIAVAVPDGAVAGSLIALLLAILAPTLGSLRTLVAVNSVKDDTAKMLNGVMDRKLEAAVHRVLDARGVGAPGSSSSQQTQDA